VSTLEITQLTTDLFQQAIRQFLAALADREQLINDLNVYPVPDSDTGTNSLVTLRAGVAKMSGQFAEEQIGKEQFGKEQFGKEQSLKEVATELAVGATSSALGNSGIILASYLNGLADGLSDQVDLVNWRLALTAAAKSAYESVLHPTQGTILTIADSVNNVQESNLTAQLISNSQAARIALAKTPEQLEILKVAGVVDAGAVVLTLFHDAFAKIVSDANFEFIELDKPSCVSAHEYFGPAHELMFSVRLDVAGKINLIETLENYGDSIAITTAESESAGEKLKHRVHVHCDNPDHIIAKAKLLGEVTDLVLINLKLRSK
jgi:uncharacterized protein